MNKKGQGPFKNKTFCVTCLKCESRWTRNDWAEVPFDWFCFLTSILQILKYSFVLLTTLQASQAQQLIISSANRCCIPVLRCQMFVKMFPGLTFFLCLHFTLPTSTMAVITWPSTVGQCLAPLPHGENVPGWNSLGPGAFLKCIHTFLSCLNDLKAHAQSSTSVCCNVYQTY